MIKKITTHIVFFAILGVGYIVFSIIYSRKLEVLSTVLYFFVLALILFSINLNKNRKIKWLIASFIVFLFITLEIMGFDAPDGNLLYLFMVLSPANLPFLPLHFDINIENKIIRLAVLYLIYFWGALLYWYIVYRLSQKIVNIACIQYLLNKLNCSCHQ